MSDPGTVQVNEKAVRDLISSKSVSTFFQPIVSIPTKSIIGFEAFSRGGGDACSIDSRLLFHDELSPEVKLDVDRLCREKALNQFKAIHENHKGLLLYLNVNPDILPIIETGIEVLEEQVSKACVAQANVVLECTLNNQHLEMVEGYSKKYRHMPYKFCLDNCHVDDPFGHAIGRVRPNFVKVNRSFFADGERKEYSQGALNVLVSMARKYGTSVIGHGVETEEESIRLLTAGVHLQQGYYYTKDENDTTGDPAKMFFQKIIETYEKYKVVSRELVRRKKERVTNTFRSVTSICSKFSNMSEDRFEEGCNTLVRSVDNIVSMFVLSSNGVQITHRAHKSANSGTANSDSILGSHKGMDHSIEDYVLYLDMGYEKFVTPPFSSPYTGELSCLISKPFFNREGERYMACIEMPHPG